MDPNISQGQVILMVIWTALHVGFYSWAWHTPHGKRFYAEREGRRAVRR